jgi:RNA recognition motif-containing protein
VKFPTPELAKKACEEHRFPVFKGKTCRLLPYNKDLFKNTESQSIFVKHVPKNYTHADLYKLFEKVGPIRSVKVSINELHESNGFGYVTFEDLASVAKAIEQVSSLTFAGEHDQSG